MVAVCSEIAVSPDWFPMASQETLPLTFDASSVVLAGESIQSAIAELVQLDSGVNYTSGLSGNVTIVGTDLTQVVTALTPRKRYRLIIRFVISANKAWAPYLLIECPE